MMFGRDDCTKLVNVMPKILPECRNIPEGTMMTINKRMMPAIKHMRIFMSFHHICFRTRFAPRLKPCAETARLSVLSCSESRRSPRWETLLMFSRITPTVSSICCNRSELAKALSRIIRIDGKVSSAELFVSQDHTSLLCSP